MADLEEIKKELAADGFGNFNVCPGPANEVYPEHTHDFTLAHVVLEGEMTLFVEGIPHVLRPGDRIDVPAHVVHSLTLGPQGCTHLAAQK